MLPVTNGELQIFFSGRFSFQIYEYSCDVVVIEGASPDMSPQYPSVKYCFHFTVAILSLEATL